MKTMQLGASIYLAHTTMKNAPKEDREKAIKNQLAYALLFELLKNFDELVEVDGNWDAQGMEFTASIEVRIREVADEKS